MVRGWLAIGAAAMIASSAVAQGNPTQMLQGLLNRGGSSDNDQALREAYERGYRNGRQDEARLNSRGGGDDPRRSGGPAYPQQPSYGR